MRHISYPAKNSSARIYVSNNSRNFSGRPAKHGHSFIETAIDGNGTGRLNRAPAVPVISKRELDYAFLKKTKDLREHAITSPLGKELDGYEWVLFIAAHSERHTKQIDEVKADPNFPKK